MVMKLEVSLMNGWLLSIPPAPLASVTPSLAPLKAGLAQGYPCFKPMGRLRRKVHMGTVNVGHEETNPQFRRSPALRQAEKRGRP
jgi:hypothetical protein